MIKILIKLCLSFALVAFGQPSLSGPLSIAAASFGLALFWEIEFPRRFLAATIWFTAVQLVQLDWLATTHYMGFLILVVYVVVAALIGLQFGLLTSFIKKPLGWFEIVALSCFWVLLEYSRVYFFTGFTWNPIGLSLASNEYSIQLASLLGIYGLCFWVIFTNLVFLKNRWLAVPVALFPYFFGFCHQLYWQTQSFAPKVVHVALVQTMNRPEGRSALDEWQEVLEQLKNTKESHFDLIVLPEGAFPGGARRGIYSLTAMKLLWKDFGTVEDFPHSPISRINNLFWLQSLSNHYDAEVIAGLDDEAYNAAFHLSPGGGINRYEKQILIPVGEYIPIAPLESFLSKQFGIHGSFTFGEQTKVFAGNVPMGIFICLEETYSYLARESRVMGAELFLSISNDVWFPDSRLARHHFDHGRLRAAENGVYLLRSCNMGVTAVIDCFGKTVAVHPEESGILTLEIPLRSIPTLYTKWGDGPFLAICLLLSLRLFKKKLL